MSDCLERYNNGLNWQLKFSNSGAIVTIYDTNNIRSTVVNGKLEPEEGESLKEIIDGIKCKEFPIDSLNEDIIELTNKRQEADFYDYKFRWHEDNGNVVGIKEEKKTNDIYDFLKAVKFAGEHVPKIEIKKICYKYKTIQVLVCKSSEYVPYYLVERYRKVSDHHIYTRVGDTNTPIDKHANYPDVENLWRIHFQREQERNRNNEMQRS